MKYFQLEGIIDESTLARFMEFCNDNTSEEWTIVINSVGGSSVLATMILSIINSNSEKTTLISAGCYSAAFYIFYFAKCKRKMIYGSIGMHHRESIRGLTINEKGNPKYQEDLCHIENLKAVRDNFLKRVMTKKEKELYNSDDDVYFTFKRMREIFPNVEILR